MTLPTTTTLTDALQQACDIAGVPGAAAGVRVGGQTVCAGTGVINLRTGVPVSDSTLFQIGSITKVWTATLLMTLVQDGRVALDAPVAKYVPELPALAGAGDEELTVLHLLNHTSGLPADWFPDTGRGDDCLERFVARLDGVASAHPVGRYCSYSNAAFAVLGRLIEKVTATTWDAALRRHIIEPLGLTHTTTLPEEALLYRTAVGHLGSGGEQDVAPIWTLPRACGPAGLITCSVGDLLSFAGVHENGARTDLLGTDLIGRMQVLTVPLPGGPPGTGFGIGWGVQSWDGTRVLAHDGGTVGQAAALRVLPERGITVALLTNGGDWLRARDAFLAAIVPVVAGVAVPPPLQVPQDPPQFTARDYTGAYERSGVACEVVEVAGELELRTTVTDELEALASAEQIAKVLRPYDSDMFLARERAELPYAPVVFLRDEAGRVAYLHHGGRIAARVR